MVTIAALYHFRLFATLAALQLPLRAVWRATGTTGTLLLARKAINGTTAGRRDGIDRVLAHIRALPGCGDLHWTESTTADPLFAELGVEAVYHLRGGVLKYLDWSVTAANAAIARAAGDDQGTAAGHFLAATQGMHRLLRRHLNDEEELIVPVILKYGNQGAWLIRRLAILWGQRRAE